MSVVLLEKIEVGSSGAASLEFTNIDNSGLHLLLVLSLRHDVVGPYGFAKVQLNGDDTVSNYYYQEIKHQGNGPVQNSYGNSYPYWYVNGDTSTADTFGNSEYFIYDYNSTSNKSFSARTVMEQAATNNQSQIIAGTYQSSSAITSITIGTNTGNFLEFSTVALYAISEE